MALDYTVTDLPPVWPGKRTTYPKGAPFKSRWSATEKALERELGWRHLGARKIELALELRNGGMDLRNDGKLRADARPGRAVILSFLDRDGQRQAYPCDRYGWWEDNLHAIAVVLEDLRRAERYGVQSALLRAGFKALPSRTAPTMDTTAAAEVIAMAAEGLATPILIAHDKEVAKTAVRHAIHHTHPDRNLGGRAAYDRVDEARKVLSSHHEVSL
jgi:hypothetical protein